MLHMSLWAPSNHSALVEHLERWRSRASTMPLLALFDFDNTSIFHDIGEAVMRHQLEQMIFSFAPTDLPRVMPLEAFPHRRLSSGEDLYEIRDALTRLYREISALRQRGATEDSVMSSGGAEFGALFAWLYEALVADPLWGPAFAYPFLVRWQAGRAPGDVRAHAAATVRSAQAEAPGRVPWPVRTGRWAGRGATFATGLFPFEEIRELMTVMRSIGMTVCIISASEQHLVEGAVQALAYPVDPAHIFGMRLRTEGGVLCPDLQNEDIYPVTYRRGKQQIVERFLQGVPVFAAGDSDTDYEMLTAFPELDCRLLVDRRQTGLVEALFHDPKTLVQGRDERCGTFLPAHRSRLWADELT